MPATRKAGWVALAAAILTVGLITYGTWVRVSGSGLGCGTDWPLCNGNVVPGFQGDTGVEFGHRLYASFTTIFVIAVAWFGWRARREDSLLAKLAVGSLGAIILQALLGAITVVTDLNGNIRLAHLSNAMLTLALLTATAVRGLDIQGVRQPGTRLSAFFAGWAAVVILAGGSIVGNNLGAACPHVPFCDSRSTTQATWLHDTHRALAGLLLLGLIWLAVWLARHKASRVAKTLVHTATLFVVIQGIVGVEMVTHILPEGLRILHVGIATLIFWALITQWILALKGRSEPG